MYVSVICFAQLTTHIGEYNKVLLYTEIPSLQATVHLDICDHFTCAQANIRL